jgi:exonuclease SbcC
MSSVAEHAPGNAAAPWQELAAELREAGHVYEEFVQRQCAELERLCGELDEGRREMEAQRQWVDELQRLNEMRAVEFAERDDRVAELSAELEQARGEAEQLRGEAAARQADCAERDERLEAQDQELVRLRTQRTAADERVREALAALEAARRVAAERESAARERESAREALAHEHRLLERAQAEAQELRQSVEEVRAAGQHGQDDRAQLQRECDRLRSDRDAAEGELAGLRTTVARLEGELATERQTASTAQHELVGQWSRLDEERTTLELQLETVLARAAELAARHAREMRQARDERAAWEQERESLQAALAARQGMRATPVRAVRPATPGADPVLASVVAQFANAHGESARGRRSGGP